MTPTSSRSDGGTGSAPRQARAVATRDAILDAAAHEFAAAGYRAASLSRIQERSRVTKGALYFHFASKEEMARAVVVVMERRFPEVVAEFEAAGHEAMVTAIHLALGLADLLLAEVHCRGGMRVASEGVLGEARGAWVFVFWEDVFVDLFGRARADGALRGDVDLRVLAQTVVALGHGHRVVSTVATGLADLRERAEASWDLLLDRIADPGWLARWRVAGGFATVPRGGADEAATGVP